MWVLFDLDGTLTQSEEGIWNCARHALRTMGRPEPDEATLRKFIGPPLMWSFQNLAGMAEEDALKAQGIYRERYNAVGLFENRVYPGIRYALRCLKKAGFRMGVVTGKPEKPTKRILEHFGLAEFFDEVVASTEVRKTKIDVLEYVAENCGIMDISKAVMVGDRHYDITGAHHVGLDSIGVLYGYGDRQELEEAGATFIAETVPDIGKYIM